MFTKRELFDILDSLVLADHQLVDATNMFTNETQASRGTAATFEQARFALNVRADRLAILRSKVRAMVKDAPDA